MWETVPVTAMSILHLLRNILMLCNFYFLISVIGSKKYCRLHFICMGRGDHCLYDQTFFTNKTKHPRIWMHVMFLAVQVRSNWIQSVGNVIFVMYLCLSNFVQVCHTYLSEIYLVVWNLATNAVFVWNSHCLSYGGIIGNEQWSGCS